MHEGINIEEALKTAVVMEDDVHAVIDLKKSGEIDFWSFPEYRFACWNKEEKVVFGLVKSCDETLQLSFTVNHLGEHELEMPELLQRCNWAYEEILTWE